METISYNYEDAVRLLDELVGRSVDVQVDSGGPHAMPAATFGGKLSRWTPPPIPGSEQFEQAVVAFFTVGKVRRDGLQPKFSVAEGRFLGAERYLMPGEPRDELGEVGEILVRLTGGVRYTVIWGP